jgi:hypothetical protein
MDRAALRAEVRMKILPLPGCIAWGVLALCLPAAAQTYIPAFEVEGRVAVNEPHACDGGNVMEPERIGLLTWTECHAVKQHMDAAGAPITADAFVPDALRPLQMTVDIDIWCAYAGHAYSDGAPIASVRTQTDSAGRFRARLPKSPCGLAGEPADGVVLRASGSLLYDMTDAAGSTVGTIRALWERTRGESVYASVLPPAPTVFRDGSGEYVIPRFILAHDVLPVLPPALVDLGNLAFFKGASPYYFGYLRGAMGAWQTLVNMHHRLQSALVADGHDSMYPRMFADYWYWGCTRCYSLFFAVEGAGGFGGRGVFNFPRPDPGDSPWTYRSLISVGFAGHEFGHSMHAAVAPSAMIGYDGTWAMTQDTAGSVGYGRFVPSFYGAQPQEMLFSLVEGFGQAMGNYFLNGCSIAERGWGDPDPRQAWWNFANYRGCDAADPFCPYRNFRYQMSQRGIAENSATWDARLASLSDLADRAAAAGAIMVNSNNEFKTGNFFCDLLDDDPDVSYARWEIGGRTYLPDYAWHAAERIDGRAHALAFATYASDPPPERVRLSIGRVLKALDAFAAGASYPGVLPSPIVDGANRVYDDVRMSVNGAFSLQAFSRYLVANGHVSRDDINGILRGNRMEEIP